MNYFLGIALLIFFGGITRIVDEKNIKWLTAVYGVWLFISLVLTGQTGLPALLVLIISLALFYFWLKLLYRYQDTIFTYLIILILGGILVGIV